MQELRSVNALAEKVLNSDADAFLRYAEFRVVFTTAESCIFPFLPFTIKVEMNTVYLFYKCIRKCSHAKIQLLYIWLLKVFCVGLCVLGGDMPSVLGEI